MSSTTFEDGATTPDSMIYAGFGLSGGNRSPQIAWSDVPDGAKSFAIVCHDPDAPTSGGFYHWVFFNIPAGTHELAEGAGSASGAKAIANSVLGRSDYGTNEYGGMAPPPGRAHHYHFTVYALDAEKLELGPDTSGALLEFTLGARTLGKATITGLYARP